MRVDDAESRYLERVDRDPEGEGGADRHVGVEHGEQRRDPRGVAGDQDIETGRGPQRDRTERLSAVAVAL